MTDQSRAILVIAQNLFAAEVQVHIMHLQAKNKSYAEHMALGELYEAIPDLVDALIEKYQGKYGIITGYKSIALSDNIEAIPYVKTLLTSVENARKGVTDGYLQQLVDNIIEQVASTLYKLTFLK